MKKRILITGGTDGIGLETAKILAEQGHDLVIHGRSQAKLDTTVKLLSSRTDVESFLADLSDLDQVKTLANAINGNIDVLINNAGVLKTPNTQTKHGIDVRFVVNTIAPYLLTKLLLPQITERVINLSSAAQSPVSIDALQGKLMISDGMTAYAQSKLAITMWSFAMAAKHDSPLFIAVNPGSLLASKMVKEGFGVVGNDLSIGANILVKAALSDKFSQASGAYFDNDSKQFTNPHIDALDVERNFQIIKVLEEVMVSYL